MRELEASPSPDRRANTQKKAQLARKSPLKFSLSLDVIQSLPKLASESAATVRDPDEMLAGSPDPLIRVSAVLPQFRRKVIFFFCVFIDPL
jgi:hypothetical protein